MSEKHATIVVPSPVEAKANVPAYLADAKRPFTVFVFLLPLLVFYEIGAAIWLTAEGFERAGERLRAYRMMSDAFAWLGASAAYLPGIFIAVALLAWHITIRHPWKVRPRVLLGMVIESAFWTLPLVILTQIVQRSFTAMAFAGADALYALPLGGRITIAIGAGLYEEALFRFVLIGLLHWLLVDLIRLDDFFGKVLAVAAAALAFALYHDVGVFDPGPIDWPAIATLLAAGIYFGALFVWRGFGIAVAVHAFYDLAVLVLLR